MCPGNGQVRELTPEEIAQRKAEAEQREREEWQAISYDDAVHDLVRNRYSQQAVEAILNNYIAFPDNPECIREFQELQQYRAECKVLAKQMIDKHQDTGGDSR